MAKKPAKGKIPGQGQPIDAQMDLFWRDNRNFAEVFNKAVFNGQLINPNELEDVNLAETTILRLKDGATTTLKQTRDVVKSLTSGDVWLVILGIENQMRINYLMPFRVWELIFINVARQVEEIRKKHEAERKAVQEAKEKGEKVEERELSAEEILSGFYRDDKLTPVITLVIYYGEEEWEYPKKLSDLFKETPFTGFADDMPMYLLDVRHMPKEKLDTYSPVLKIFFEFLMHENSDDFEEFIRENKEHFNNLPEQTIDALIEITHSKQLEQFKKEYRTPEGGVNVCYGIEAYGKRQWMAGEIKGEITGAVRMSKYIGVSFANTVKKIMTMFKLDEKEAEKAVKERWDEPTENSSGEK